jgi:excisionase family DNA binding protein
MDTAMPREAPGMAGADWLPISEAARALGVSPSTLRGWAAGGRVPHVRTAGGHRRFHRAVLAEWVAGRPPAARSRAERSTHIAVAPQAADALARGAQGIDGAGDGDSRQWLHEVARALASGQLGGALERAGAHGRAHGARGASAMQAVADMVAIERRVDALLASTDHRVPRSERDHAVAVIHRLEARLLDGWASTTPDGAPGT